MATQRGDVAAGGFWSSPQTSYSKETHNILKEMMQESRLTNFQQRELNKTLRGGGSLPLNCGPTSSVRKKVQKPVKVKDKVLNPRNHFGGVRTKDTMETMGAFEKPDYTPTPKPSLCTEQEKQKLANIMAFGEDLPEKKSKPPSPPKAKVKLDRFDELQKEIEDRNEFLNDMESLGQGKKYRTIIATEISQLLREMEVIDKKRTAELEKLISSEQRSKKEL